MRWQCVAIICVLAAATLVFALENMEIVSLDFIWFSVRTPLAFLAGANSERRRPRGGRDVCAPASC
jgi:hypothetical protein